MSFEEKDISQKWIENNYTHFDTPSCFLYHSKNNKNQFIPMPPPNITGKLHMGHALFLSLQDAKHRFLKNQGYNSLWAPGLDHAGIATYEKILEYKKKTGLGFNQASLEIEKTHKAKILEQIKSMGSLPDWRFYTYTLDYEEFTYTILDKFKEEGLLYFDGDQWCLNMESLAKELLEDINQGHFKISPDYSFKNLIPFLEKIEPWKISRKIEWGTIFPYQLIDGEIIKCEDKELRLDTWFNSSLFIFGILKNQKDLDSFYPANLIETGGDILFFWCARMLMMSLFIHKHQDSLGLDIKSKYCFDKIYLHGIIRDNNGEKFSKSLGNGIDPLDMIRKYGADATRLFLLTRSGAGEDIIFDEKDLGTYAKFINKIYQSARFLSINADKAGLNKLSIRASSNIKFLAIKEKFIEFMEEDKYLEASRFIHSQYKSFFCDEYLEENKRGIWDLDKEKIEESIYLMIGLLGLLEPFCPHICHYLLDHFIDI